MTSDPKHPSVIIAKTGEHMDMKDSILRQSQYNAICTASVVKELETGELGFGFLNGFPILL